MGENILFNLRCVLISWKNKEATQALTRKFQVKKKLLTFCKVRSFSTKMYTFVLLKMAVLQEKNCIHGNGFKKFNFKQLCHLIPKYIFYMFKMAVLQEKNSIPTSL